jgi:hypothetical protein
VTLHLEAFEIKTYCTIWRLGIVIGVMKGSCGLNTGVCIFSRKRH